LAAFSAFGILIPLGNIAHGAHLGGILLGLAYVRFGKRFSADFTDWMPSWLKQRQPRPAPGSRAKHSPWRRPAQEDQRSYEFISQQVDPILDKISAHGIHSLTDKERKILEAARQQMGSRKSK
jgi:hypothetical protein